jgi:hypothetical protein
MASSVKTAVTNSAHVCDAGVSFEDKLRNARTVLVSILGAKKHMMDVDEKMEFLSADEGLYALIHGMPGRNTREETLAMAMKLLKRYGKKGVL